MTALYSLKSGNIRLSPCRDMRGEWVDRLSLALSLAGDHDPRVEKEVERMLEEIKW